jgi:hypothetical protein
VDPSPVSEGLLERAWPFLAAAAGSFTSVAFLKPLTWAGRIVAWAIGLLAAIFIAPALVDWWFPKQAATSPWVALTYYIVSVSAMTVIPPFLKWAADKAGNPLSWLTKATPSS